MAASKSFRNLVDQSQLSEPVKAFVADLKRRDDPLPLVSLFAKLEPLPRELADGILHDVRDIAALAQDTPVRVPLGIGTLANGLRPAIFAANTRVTVNFEVTPTVATATKVAVAFDSYLDYNLIAHLTKHITTLYPDLLRINPWANSSPLMLSLLSLLVTPLPPDVTIISLAPHTDATLCANFINGAKSHPILMLIEELPGSAGVFHCGDIGVSVTFTPKASKDVQKAARAMVRIVCYPCPKHHQHIGYIGLAQVPRAAVRGASGSHALAGERRIACLAARRFRVLDESLYG